MRLPRNSQSIAILVAVFFVSLLAISNAVEQLPSGCSLVKTFCYEPLRFCERLVCVDNPPGANVLYPEYSVKRSKPTFMRLGKRASNFMRFGKRASNFMRFGKRASNFMRFGKRLDDSVYEPELADDENNFALPESALSYERRR